MVLLILFGPLPLLLLVDVVEFEIEFEELWLMMIFGFVLVFMLFSAVEAEEVVAVCWDGAPPSVRVRIHCGPNFITVPDMVVAF